MISMGPFQPELSYDYNFDNTGSVLEVGRKPNQFGVLNLAVRDCLVYYPKCLKIGYLK